jgi:aspartate/methionine/tyrosine aminotransferase
VDVAPWGSSVAVAEAALEQRVITVPGGAFGSEAEGFLRLSFCADEKTRTEGMRRVGLALAQLKPVEEQRV